MQEFVVPKSMPNTFAIKFKKMVVCSLFQCNNDAAIPKTTWKPLKQRVNFYFFSFKAGLKTVPKAS
jgi:hypothetical protein